MNRNLSFLFSCVFILAVLLAGCENSPQTEKAGETLSGMEQAESLTGETQSQKQEEQSEENKTREMMSGQIEQIPEEDVTTKMSVQIGGNTFTATLEENEAVAAFLEMMEKSPVTIEMRDYSGFEKVGSLGQSLPASNRQITTQSGDIVLYQGSQLVIFYGSNSWSYTRIGKIDNLTGWKKALGRGNVNVTFSLEE